MKEREKGIERRRQERRERGEGNRKGERGKGTGIERMMTKVQDKRLWIRWKRNDSGEGAREIILKKGQEKRWKINYKRERCKRNNDEEGARDKVEEK